MIAPTFTNNGPELDRRFSFLYRANGAWHEEVVTAKNYAMACCILGFRHGPTVSIGGRAAARFRDRFGQGIRMLTAEIKSEKIPAAEALAIAREFVSVLQPRTQRLLIAGSLRRRCPFVSDIEILFVPRLLVVPGPVDLFGHKSTILVNDSENVITSLVAAGLFPKRPKSDGSFIWGPLNKLGIHAASGISVDLFTANDINWWNYLVCRTGPAENNVRICNAAIPYGSGFTRQGDYSGDREERIVQSEREVFDFVGLPYREPWER